MSGLAISILGEVFVSLRSAWTGGFNVFSLIWWQLPILAFTLVFVAALALVGAAVPVVLGFPLERAASQSLIGHGIGFVAGFLLMQLEIGLAWSLPSMILILGGALGVSGPRGSEWKVAGPLALVLLFAGLVAQWSLPAVNGIGIGKSLVGSAFSAITWAVLSGVILYGRSQSSVRPRRLAVE